jgi:phosphoglycerate dehydrogenase-like enzyme
MTPSILITEQLSDEAFDWLAARAQVVRLGVDDPQFNDALATASALIVRTYTVVDDALLQRAPVLTVVGRAGVGLDNIDLDACKARDVRVVHTPDSNTQAVVEYVLSVLSHAMRPLQPIAGASDAAQWGQLRNDVMVLRQWSDLRLGILGCGRIGSRVACLAKAIGMETACCDLRQLDLDQLHGARQVDLDTLLCSSDVLSVHVDGRPENRHLLTTEHFKAMPEDALLINTSRGFVLDHAALAGVLAQRPAMRAMLDVHDPEPVGADNPLLAVPNATLLPHAASRTQTAQRAMSWVVRDVAEALGLPMD